MINEEKLTELLENEEFIKKTENVETVDGLKNVFAENGLELTAEEVESLVAKAKAANEKGELSEDDLNDVAGGMSLRANAAYVGAKVIWYLIRNRRR